MPNGCDLCADADDALDTDQDGVPNACDQCPEGPDGVDGDLDGVADACDVCDGFDDLSDTDADNVPDGCDACPGFDDALDSDGDGLPDDCDDPTDTGVEDTGVVGVGSGELLPRNCGCSNGSTGPTGLWLMLLPMLAIVRRRVR